MEREERVMNKGIGEKLLGLFIEEDVDGTDETAAPPREKEAPPQKAAPMPPGLGLNPPQTFGIIQGAGPCAAPCAPPICGACGT